LISCQYLEFGQIIDTILISPVFEDF